MSIEQIVGLIITLVIMFIGVAGSILPTVPSTPLILLAAVGHKLYFGETGASTTILIILTILTALSLILDYLVSAYGAKKMGASKGGVVGSIMGGLVGIFFGIPGIILGPFVGAMLFEILGGRTIKKSGRAGVGATIGLFASAIAKLACCVAMIGLFVFDVVYIVITNQLS